MKQPQQLQPSCKEVFLLNVQLQTKSLFNIGHMVMDQYG